MAGPLSLLCVLALFGGWIALPLDSVFPAAADHHGLETIELVSTIVPLLGLLIAWLVYYRKSLPIDGFTDSTSGKALRKFWYSGWAMDKLYDTILVTPFVSTAVAMKDEWLDKFYHAIVAINQGLHRLLSSLQNGRMRAYATSMVFGLIVLVTIIGWSVLRGAGL